MRQNLALSAVILIVLIPLAASGTLGLATVAATHELAEVLVIANGVRAGRRARPRRPPTTPPASRPIPGASADLTVLSDIGR